MLLSRKNLTICPSALKEIDLNLLTEPSFVPLTVENYKHKIQADSDGLHH